MFEDYKDIYVIVEQRSGAIQKVGIELLGEAEKLAKDLGQKVVAVVIGSDIKAKAEEMFQYGADRVLCVDDPILKTYTTEPYTQAITHIITEYKPNIVIFGATSIGRDLAPRCAGRVHTGLTADCTKLTIAADTKLLEMTRPAFGGNIMATILIKNHRPQMATVRPGVMVMATKDASKKGEVEMVKVNFEKNDCYVDVIEVTKDQNKKVDITEQKVLISGGRGVGGPEGYEPLRELAHELGGEVSSSRIGVDSGWIEKDRQVGQTGKTVRPNLYMACGISGAIQHLAGMEDSDCIIAINRDDSCPMMQLADLGIVGDLKKIVPALTEAVRKYKKDIAVS